MAVTLGIYYLTPWIRWDRGPNLPDQAVLVDMAGRRFYFFWIEIWPHEFYFVAGLLIMAGLGLFLFTSALGRVWCGYTCPQTVWTDLFILVERWIEGDRNARVRLWNAKWDVRKIRLRLTKWMVWLLIAVATGGAWVFYFTDAPTLVADLVTLQRPSDRLYHHRRPDRHDLLLWRLRARTGLHLCLPLAAHSGRDDGRGHDHRRLSRMARRAARQASQGRGRRAVWATASTAWPASNVCPMGIDIRDGQQMECITCALCIDACDDVMAQDRQAARADRLSGADRRGGERAGQAAAADLEACPAPAHDDLHRALVRRSASACLSRCSSGRRST